MSLSLGFDCVTLSDNEKSDLELNMAAAFDSLKQAAVEKYGFANVKKLRNEYKKGLVELDRVVRSKMDWMIAHESRIISGYIKLANKLCVQFNRSSKAGVILNDFLQEGAMAIYDAMYEYNGEAKFTTYVYWCIRNRLLDFLRRENANRKVENSLNKAAARVRDMTVCGVTADKAISRISGADEFDSDVIEWVQSSVRKKTDTPVSSLTGESIEMWKAVESTPLTEMERNLVEAHLRGDNSYRAKVADTLINENTGKPWTRQRLSQIFLRACEKIRMTYEIGNRAVA